MATAPHEPELRSGERLVPYPRLSNEYLEPVDPLDWWRALEVLARDNPRTDSRYRPTWRKVLQWLLL